MIRDPKIMLAVSRILQRSERQVDDQKILDTFVDLGILAQLSSRNNQIIYGRRGTGKTHVFRVLGSQLISEDTNHVVVYVDARTLGSSAQFSDIDLPMQQRVVALLRDIFAPIYNNLLEHMVEKGDASALKALDLLDTLIPSITETSKPTKEKQTTTAAASTKNSLSASLGTTKPLKMEAAASAEGVKSNSSTIEQEFVPSDDKIIFPSISDPLTELLKITDTQLYLLIDEWSSLPLDIQPFLADFIKRTLLPVQSITVKIAALEYRTHFSISELGNQVGFELGADIATAPDLDDYYVYDRNPEKITDAYGDILLRHLNVELEPDYMAKVYGITKGSHIASRLFTQRSTMQELARASEGVIRDLINIFTKAFFHAHRRDRDTLDQKAVIEGAREWFEQDKARGLDEAMSKVLRRIVDVVIGERRARSFLMQRDFEKLPIIQKLIDARVLHHIARGYADKDNPGVRYNIYSLDYGTYVDLINTSKQPMIDFEAAVGSVGETPDVVVPFDDKRSIRRIIVDERIFQD